MKIVNNVLSTPAFWIGLCFVILSYIQFTVPKAEPLTEAQRKDHEEMMVQFAL